MKLYDSDPSGYSDEPISWYEGEPTDRDESIFTNFRNAKFQAMERYDAIIADAKDKLGILAKMTVKDCTQGINPFTDI